MKRIWLIISVCVLLLILLSVILVSKFTAHAQVKKQLNLGNKYLSEGKYHECILTFENVIKIDKKNAEARLKLTEAYLKTGRIEDARKVSLEILDINPSDKEIYIRLADMMVMEGRLDDAIFYLKKPFNKTKDPAVEKKLIELSNAQPLTTIEASVIQDSPYSLPEKIKLKINSVEEEQPVKWTNPKVDTKITGTYTFDGNVEEYNRKVRLTLTVKPKDLFTIKGREVSMDKKQKEALDDYLTNFSVLHTAPFENSNISDEELINFGIMYIDWRESEKVEFNPDGCTAKIKASDVDDICMYYLGKKPSAHKSIQGYDFNEGYAYKDGIYTYYYGPTNYTFSQADRLFDLGDNLYRVDISTYVGDSGFNGNIHASPSELLRQSQIDGTYLEIGDKMTAIIKKINDDNTERYILISYKVQTGNTGVSTEPEFQK